MKKTLDIIYEDRSLLVVNKKAGLLTIATAKEKDRTLYHEVYMYLKKKNQKVFIVHRLDKDTSGVVVFAKTEKMKLLLQKDWNNLVKVREYLAIVEGKVEKEQAILTNYLMETKTLRTYISNSKKGQLAITKYKLIKYIKDYSVLQVFIETGRKNQIRVQLSNMRNPIIGDKKYGSTKNPIRRLGLHAHRLILINPITKKEMEFLAPIPDSFLTIIKL